MEFSHNQFYKSHLFSFFSDSEMFLILGLKMMSELNAALEIQFPGPHSDAMSILLFTFARSMSDITRAVQCSCVSVSLLFAGRAELCVSHFELGHRHRKQARSSPVEEHEHHRLFTSKMMRT